VDPTAGFSTLSTAPAPVCTPHPSGASLLLSGRTVRSSIEGDGVPEVFIPRLIALHRAGSLPFDRFCRHYPVDAINDAVADCRRGDTIKPILHMEPGDFRRFGRSPAVA